jgi:hypothetical protein
LFFVFKFRILFLKGTKMRTSKMVFTIAFAFLLLLSGSIHAEPLGTAFTYQGRLIDANEPADGLYDLQFTLYDAMTEGAVVGSAVNKADMNVTDGYITVELDFGSVFDGNNRWLQIGIRPGALIDPSAYTVLTPRQKVTPTPYALHAKSVSAPLALTAAAPAGTSVLGVGSTGEGVAIGASSRDGDIGMLGKNGSAVVGMSSTGFAGYFSGKGYFSGNVGIGTTTPSEKLTVENGTIMATNSLSAGKGVYGVATGGSFSRGVCGEASNSGNYDNYGGYFLAWGGQGVGVQGYAGNNGNVSNTGGSFCAEGATGFGVSGYATHSNGINYGVYGRTDSPNGYAGYFTGGRNYFAGNVGIGALIPTAKLEVAGVVKITGGTPGLGKVLTSDASGLATWQTPSGGGAGDITAVIAGTGLDGGGTGGDVTLSVEAPLVLTSSGASGTISGTATDPGGRGIYGYAANSSSYGGYFEAAGSQGRGVYGRATSSIGTGVYGYGGRYGGEFHASGTDGDGIRASGGTNGYAAVFLGNVRICNQNGSTTVMELGQGLDYAEGFHVSDKGGISPGTVLVIDRKNPGKLAVSQKAYDKTVAGIAAGAKGLGSGVRLGVEGFDCDVALAGRVYCNVDAAKSAIEPGDMLTTSDNVGYAMKADDSARATGAILGKAMEPLEKGKQGQILVLVTLQ